MNFSCKFKTTLKNFPEANSQRQLKKIVFTHWHQAKILLPGGSKDVPIGKLLCIIVSNLEDVAKFKNFKAEEAAPAAESPMQQVGV